jgi:iron complex transport system ATP-binding protein
LKLQQLSIGYPHKVIAQHISAQLSEASLTALVGVNGAGKSTLLRTLTGEQKALEGALTLHGKALNDYSRGERARQIAVVLTQRVEASQMLAEEVVALGRLPYTNLMGSLKPADLEVVNHAIRVTGITHLRQRRIGSLSDGERQRVMLAKALAQETPFILMDEPTAFLDYPSRTETFMLLRKLAHEERKSILLSTHDLDLALKCCDQIWLLDKGTLTIGTPQDFSQNKALDRAFSTPNFQFDTTKFLTL